jgi:hypothetical protein
MCPYCLTTALTDQWFRGGICESCLDREKDGLPPARMFLGSCRSENHPFTPENTYLYWNFDSAKWGRSCRTCRRSKNERLARKWNLKKKEQRAADRARLKGLTRERFESEPQVSDPMWDGIDPSGTPPTPETAR